MGPYVTVGMLLLAGWTFLNLKVSWAYLVAIVLFELWLAKRLAAAGRGAPAHGEPPYHFTPEEADFVGRYRFYFTYPQVARQSASVLAALGITALVLVPWLTYKLAFAQAVLVGVNLFLVARLTKALSPLMALRVRAHKGDRAALRLLELHGPLWEKIRAANAGVSSAG